MDKITYLVVPTLLISCSNPTDKSVQPKRTPYKGWARQVGETFTTEGPEEINIIYLQNKIISITRLNTKRIFRKYWETNGRGPIRTHKSLVCHQTVLIIFFFLGCKKLRFEEKNSWGLAWCRFVPIHHGPRLKKPATSFTRWAWKPVQC